MTVEPLQQYTVTFISNGGTAVDDVKVIADERLMKPENPIMVGGSTTEGLYAGIIDPEKIEGSFSAGFNYPLTKSFNFGLTVTF